MSMKNKVMEFYNGCTRPREGEEEVVKNRFIKLIILGCAVSRALFPWALCIFVIWYLVRWVITLF